MKLGFSLYFRFFLWEITHVTLAAAERLVFQPLAGCVDCFFIGSPL